MATYKEIVEKMKYTYTSKDGEEKVLYKFNKNKKRILLEGESVYFVVRDIIKEYTMTGGYTGQFKSYFWDGDFVTKTGDIVESRVTIQPTKSILDTLERFDIPHEIGDVLCFYKGKDFTVNIKGDDVIITPTGVTAHELDTSIVADTNKEDKKYVGSDNTNIEDIDMADLI